MPIKNINYKILAILPIILAIVSIGIIYVNGLEKSIDVSGGVEITVMVHNNVNIDELKKMLPDGTIVRSAKTASGTFIIITANNNVNVDEINNALKKFLNIDDLNKVQYSFKQIGPTLSKKFWTDGFKALGFAFIFMAIVVYLVFRTPIPSGAVVLAAICDIIFAICGMSIFHIPVSTATVAALLMLLGYSVDTDIMLTTRVLKRGLGSIDERIKGAMKTGLTMSITTIVAMFVLYLVVTFIVPAASVLKDIAAVLLFGLIGDIMTTWLTNAGILKYYVEEYKGKK